MGYLTRVFAPRAEAAGDALQRAIHSEGGGRTLSGARVSEDTAMGIAAVWACVRVVSEDIAKLPLILYRRLPGGGRARATDHPLYRLLHDAPNGLHTSFAFREMMQAAVELRGNAYALKVRVRGLVTELLPIHPSKVSVTRRDDWEPVYRVGQTEYGRADMLHIAGLSIDGFTGVSPITMHRESIGLSLATLQHGARLFGNAARPAGILESPKTLSDEAAVRIKASWESQHGGENMHRTALLEEGLTWKPVTMTSEDAQYLETRKFQRAEIAGIFRIPPHKIQDLERATFGNIEHQALEYVIDALHPRLTRWEQRLNADLLTPAEREVYYCEFLVDGLLRGDQRARYDAYKSAIDTGWMAPNEARVRENLNPVAGLDEYRRALNTEPVGSPGIPREEAHGNAR